MVINWCEYKYCWIDSFENHYMSVIDMPEDLQISWVDNPSLLQYYALYCNLFV